MYQQDAQVTRAELYFGMPACLVAEYQTTVRELFPDLTEILKPIITELPTTPSEEGSNKENVPPNAADASNAEKWGISRDLVPTTAAPTATSQLSLTAANAAQGKVVTSGIRVGKIHKHVPRRSDRIRAKKAARQNGRT